MIKTDPYKLTDEYQEIADSANCSLVTVQSHHEFTTWVVVDDRTQAERMAANVARGINVDIAFQLKPGEAGRYDLPSGKAHAKIVQPGAEGLVAVVIS